MRLIDADELPVKTDWHKQYVLYTAIDEAPTIDAAPVVRCKDCKWYQKATYNELSQCLHPSGYVGEGMGSLFHCCMGERKDGDGNG